MGLIIPDWVRPKQKKEILKNRQEEQAYVAKIGKVADSILETASKEGMSVSDIGLLTKILNDKLNYSFNQKKISEVIEKKDEIEREQIKDE